MPNYCPHCVTPTARAQANSAEGGMFGRLFPQLAAAPFDQGHDLALAVAGGPMDIGQRDDDAFDNPRIPAGWAFFGQILAHDMTRDRAPLQPNQVLDGLRNYRRPRLDLECVYGDGPLGQPYLYDNADGDKLLVAPNDQGEPNDIPRTHQGIAVIGDQRNDTYLFIAHLHVALLKLHNRLVDTARADGVSPGQVFETAQRLTRWHYQWVVVNEYLPLHAGEEDVAQVLNNGPQLLTAERPPFVPVEFAAAVFRFGHAQVRTYYDVNEAIGRIALFPDLVGQRPLLAAQVPDWRRFFTFPGEPAPQASKRIDALYTHGLMHLPPQLTGALAQPEHAALAYRDIQRGASLGLPSGEAVAETLGVTPLSREELALPDDLCRAGTPLAYYIQREAMVQRQGEYLGAVGGRVLAEVLLSLLLADPTAYLDSEPAWQPTLPAADGTFRLADLLTAAGVAGERG